MKTTRLVVVGAALFLALIGQARAGMIIDTGTSSSLHNFSGGDYVAGSEFTTATSLTIRSLAWLDAEGDGLIFSHKIGLWSTAEVLLASVTVTPTSATVLSAQGTAVWYLENITPIVLSPGTYRVAGLVGALDHNARAFDKIGNGVTLSSGYVRTWFPSGGFNYPNLTYSTDAIRASLSGDFVATEIPEPSSLALAGLGLLVIAFSAARRRRRA